jgi:hypothetical protein
VNLGCVEKYGMKKLNAKVSSVYRTRFLLSFFKILPH